MITPRSTWRDALPRVNISEASTLPVARLAAILVSTGERVAALEAYREVLEAAPDDLAALSALAALLSRLGRDAEEITIQRRIAVITVARMSLAPEHRGAAVDFELATLGIGATPTEMPAAYTAALFDAYAAKFDASLRHELRYRAPELLHESLLRALDSSAQSAGSTRAICDVGCGTGLLGPLLRPMARRLDGVDRSPRMLDEARALGIYDDLTEADLTATLASRPDAYDIVTAADVLVYIGDLAPALAAIATALHHGGIAAFTVERGDEERYRLTASGRYEHAPAFVRESAAAAGLGEVSVDEVTLRLEQAQPVLGLVWMLRKDRERALG